jgi:hypothetical protein
LRFILRHCGVRQSTPHSSGFARLACGAFYTAVAAHLFTFCEGVKETKCRITSNLWEYASGPRRCPW